MNDFSQLFAHGQASAAARSPVHCILLLGSGSRPFLPCLDVPGHEAKRWVWLWMTYMGKLNVSRRITDCQLRQQVTPLVYQLAARHCDNTRSMPWANLPRRKRVAATYRLGVNTTKVVCNRANRRALSAESLQLWVMQIAVRATP